MEASSNETVKRIYITPKVTQVELDVDVSLALESAPPNGPNEFSQQLEVPEYFNNKFFI